MRSFTASAYILSAIAASYAFTPTELAPSTIADGSSTVVAYWSPIATLPPQPIVSSKEHEHLELRAAPVADVPAAPAVPAAQPAHPAGQGAAGAVNQPAVAPAAPQAAANAADDDTTPANAAAIQASKAAAAQAAAASKAAAAQAAAAAAAAPAAPVAPVAPVAPGVGVGGAGAAAAPAQPAATNPTQVPSVTHYQATKWVNGVAQQIPIVYTQTFSDTPSPGPKPFTNGAIGMGTITGPVGPNKTGHTKRSAGCKTRREGLRIAVAGTIFLMLGMLSAWA